MTIAETAAAMKVSPASVKRAKQRMREDPEAHALAKAGQLPKKKPSREERKAAKVEADALRRDIREYMDRTGDTIGFAGPDWHYTDMAAKFVAGGYRNIDTGYLRRKLDEALAKEGAQPTPRPEPEPVEQPRNEFGWGEFHLESDRGSIMSRTWSVSWGHRTVKHKEMVGFTVPGGRGRGDRYLLPADEARKLAAALVKLADRVGPTGAAPGTDPKE